MTIMLVVAQQNVYSSQQIYKYNIEQRSYQLNKKRVAREKHTQTIKGWDSEPIVE